MTYRDTLDRPAYGLGPDNGHSWRDHTRRSLLWLYGPERAHAIETGKDTRTNADLAAWRNLGRGKGGQ